MLWRKPAASVVGLLKYPQLKSRPTMDSYITALFGKRAGRGKGPDVSDCQRDSLRTPDLSAQIGIAILRKPQILYIPPEAGRPLKRKPWPSKDWELTPSFMKPYPPFFCQCCGVSSSGTIPSSAFCKLCLVQELQIFENTPVCAIEGHTAICSKGRTSKAIIVATHFPCP